MKIRIMGTREELAQARLYYEELEHDEGSLYANRGSSTLFRLYVEVEYCDCVTPLLSSKRAQEVLYD